jgi:hypothetical protein
MRVNLIHSKLVFFFLKKYYSREQCKFKIHCTGLVFQKKKKALV